MSRNKREGWYFGTVKRVFFMEPRRPVFWPNGRRHIRTKVRLAALRPVAQEAAEQKGGEHADQA
jgi:hypothetical protein